MIRRTLRVLASAIPVPLPLPAVVEHLSDEQRYDRMLAQRTDQSDAGLMKLVMFEAEARIRIADDFQRRFSYYLMGFGDGTNPFEIIEHHFAPDIAGRDNRGNVYNRSRTAGRRDDD